MAEPTYIFKDGHVYTMVDGQVVASAKEAEFNPAEAEGGPQQPGEIEMPEAPAEIAPEPCPTCGQPTSAGDQYCPSCGTALDGSGGTNDPWSTLEAERGQNGLGMGEGAPPTNYGQSIAQVVTTPNGVTGKVLARTPELWGEQVTVRWENGNITSVPVDKRLTFAATEETPAGETTVEALEKRLAAHFQSDKASLVVRGRELQAIKREAGAHVANGSSDADAVKLSSIATQAGYELSEVKAALDAINAGETEAYVAPAPIENLPTVVQASTNGGDASWLDKVHTDMVAEANAVDYKKLMDEGPEQFVASLDSAQLADATVTRVMATRAIEAKTAGADSTQQDAYEKMWLARVEIQRKAALLSLKEEVAEKTASKEESHPDESLFL